MIDRSLAILITCHNRKEKTLLCLKSLFDQNNLTNGFKFDVFLVDDGSSDGTREAINATFPLVRIIQGDGNLYWNRGMHLAWEKASKFHHYDYFLWLNDDTFLFQNALQLFVDASVETNNKSVICGSTFSEVNQMISYGGRDLKGNLIVPNGKLQVVPHTFNGNAVLIPKLVYDKVGNLDRKYPHAIGDFDYALRVRRANLKSYILGDFVGVCEGNNVLPNWCLMDIPFKQRLFSLYSPLGNSHPMYFFLFDLNHFGLFVALKHFITIHLRLISPRLWKKN